MDYTRRLLRGVLSVSQNRHIVTDLFVSSPTTTTSIELEECIQFTRSFSIFWHTKTTNLYLKNFKPYPCTYPTFMISANIGVSSDVKFFL